MRARLVIVSPLLKHNARRMEELPGSAEQTAVFRAVIDSGGLIAKIA